MPPISELFSPSHSDPNPTPVAAASSSPTIEAPSAVPENIDAYQGYRWDPISRRLLDRSPNRSGPDYSRLVLGTCRAGSMLHRTPVVSEEEGEDLFVPPQIRALMRLLEFSEDTSSIVLDQDRNEAGHICIEIPDRRWAEVMVERLESRCDAEVGHGTGCEAVVESLRSAAGLKSNWDQFVETLPVGTGFFAPGAAAAALGVAARMLWRWLGRGGPPSIPPSNTSNGGRTGPSEGRQASVPDFHRSALLLGAAVLAESVWGFLSRAGTVAGTTAAGALFAPVSIAAPCNSSLGRITNSRCGGGGA